MLVFLENFITSALAVLSSIQLAVHQPRTESTSDICRLQNLGELIARQIFVSSAKG
jgi:hypothetical protein